MCHLLLIILKFWKGEFSLGVRLGVRTPKGSQEACMQEARLWRICERTFCLKGNIMPWCPWMHSMLWTVVTLCSGTEEAGSSRCGDSQHLDHRDHDGVGQDVLIESGAIELWRVSYDGKGLYFGKMRLSWHFKKIRQGGSLNKDSRSSNKVGNLVST